MEHLHTFIISIFLAGIISYFIPVTNNNETSQIITAVNNSTSVNRVSISPETIQSWLNTSKPLTDSYHDNLPLKVANQLVVLDLRNKKSTSISNTNTNTNTNNEDRIVLITPKYWEVVHSIESKQGEMLYRPRNKEKSCANTSAPCGHYQISAQALKDIGCTALQCKIDRENLKKSLAMSQTLENINLKRLAKKGYNYFPDYQKYLIHQQGATGIKLILDAQDGRYELGKKLIKNMANNSSYSYKGLKNMGSKLAAQQFLGYWENMWDAEIEMIFDKQLKQQMAIREYLLVANNTQTN